MSTILYEASTKAQLISLIIPAAAVVFVLVLMVVLSIIFQKAYERGNTRYNPKAAKALCTVFALFLLFWCILGFGGQWNMHDRVIGAYQRGEYQTVEGYVENFVHEIPIQGEHGRDESFEINGVKFFYSAAAIQPGYHQTRANGGVITGNGQHLKIGYVYLDEVYGNVIVFIEEIPE